VGGTIYAATPPFRISTGAILTLTDQAGDRSLVPGRCGDWCSGPTGPPQRRSWTASGSFAAHAVDQGRDEVAAGHWRTVGRGTLAFARGSSTVEPPCGCSGSSRPPGCSWCSPWCSRRCGRADPPPRPRATPRTSWLRAAHCQVSSRPLRRIVPQRYGPPTSARARADGCYRCCSACWPPHARSCTGSARDGFRPVRPGPGRWPDARALKLGRRPSSSRPDRRPTPADRRGLMLEVPFIVSSPRVASCRRPAHARSGRLDGGHPPGPPGPGPAGGHPDRP
jgi:hypothetical protein